MQKFKIITDKSIGGKYKNGEILSDSIENNIDFQKHKTDLYFEAAAYSRKTDSHQKFKELTLLNKDNRKVYKELFGKPLFYYKGEFLYHEWCIEFKKYKFLLITAKTKGSSIEVILPDHHEMRADYMDGNIFIEFQTELLKKLIKYDKKLHKKNLVK